MDESSRYTFIPRDMSCIVDESIDSFVVHKVAELYNMDKLAKSRVHRFDLAPVAGHEKKFHDG